jgi:hypothetical protein
MNNKSTMVLGIGSALIGILLAFGSIIWNPFYAANPIQKTDIFIDSSAYAIQGVWSTYYYDTEVNALPFIGFATDYPDTYQPVFSSMKFLFGMCFVTMVLFFISFFVIGCKATSSSAEQNARTNTIVEGSFIVIRVIALIIYIVAIVLAYNAFAKIAEEKGIMSSVDQIFRQNKFTKFDTIKTRIVFWVFYVGSLFMTVIGILSSIMTILQIKQHQDTILVTQNNQYNQI